MSKITNEYDGDPLKGMTTYKDLNGNVSEAFAKVLKETVYAMCVDFDRMMLKDLFGINLQDCSYCEEETEFERCADDDGCLHCIECGFQNDWFSNFVLIPVIKKSFDFPYIMEYVDILKLDHSISHKEYLKWANTQRKGYTKPTFNSISKIDPKKLRGLCGYSTEFDEEVL